MVAEWLKQIDPPPTWKQIAEEVETIDPTKALIKISNEYTFSGGCYCTIIIIIIFKQQGFHKICMDASYMSASLAFLFLY